MSDAPCRLTETAYKQADCNGALGAFNPALPEDGALILAGVLRDQFTSLEAEIQLRATQAELTNGLAVAVSDAVNLASNNILPQTSNNSNGVGTLGQSAYSYYDQWQMQMVMDKIDELINALRR